MTEKLEEQANYYNQILQMMMDLQELAAISEEYNEEDV